MIIYTTKLETGVQIQIRAISKSGRVGDLTVIVKPGESYMDHPHEWWAALENGRHEVFSK